MLAGAKWRRGFSTKNMRQKATGQLAIMGNEGIYIPEMKMQNFRKILVDKQKTWESYNRAF